MEIDGSTEPLMSSDSGFLKRVAVPLKQGRNRGRGTRQTNGKNGREKAKGHCLVIPCSSTSKVEGIKPYKSASDSSEDRCEGRTDEMGVPYRVRMTERIVNEAQDESVVLNPSVPRLVSRYIRERVLSHYPILRNHNGHRAFFLYIMNTPFRDEMHGTGMPVVSRGKIARCYGEEARAAESNGNLRTGYVLELFRQQVLEDFEWTGHHSYGSARMVENTGVDPDLTEAWRRDQESSDRDGLVDFYSGSKHTPTRRTRRRRKQEAFCEDFESPCSDAQEWREYLHNRSPKLFQEMADRYLPEARQTARNQLQGRGRTQAFINLCRIEAQPKPLYRFSENTVRLTDYGSGLQNLDSDVRSVLTQDWVKFDLSSAQLAIAGRDWDIKSALAVLESGSIWDSLIDYIGVSRKLKPALKKGLYTAVYGGQRRTIKGNMAYVASKKGLSMNSEKQTKFFAHPVIDELLKKRQEQLEAIRRAGGVHDCYGNWVDLDSVDDDSPERSVLAQLAQAQEMQLITPALRLAQEEEDEKVRRPWEITLYLYDGFFVKFNYSEAYHTRSIKAAVEKRAKETNYPTALEVEEQ